MKIARGNVYEHLGQHLAQESHLSNISLLSRVLSYSLRNVYIYIYQRAHKNFCPKDILGGGEELTIDK